MSTHSSIPARGNSMDRGAWWAIVHGVTKSWTQLSTSTHTQSYTIQISADYSPRASSAQSPLLWMSSEQRLVFYIFKLINGWERSKVNDINILWYLKIRWIKISVSINQPLLELNHTHSFMHYLWSLSHNYSKLESCLLSIILKA